MERYRIYSDAAVYYVTYSVVEWLPIFVTEATFRIVADSLTFCHRQKHLRVNAYVIMPTHLHIIVFDAEYKSDRLAQSLTDFRKFTGRGLSDHCSGHFPPCFAQTLRDEATTDRERRLWQPSRHPVAIASEPFWQQKLDYLHDNPRRKGLVRSPQDWRWSSARWYFSNGKAETDIPLTPITW
jgi:REP element-mobilizing transposase RayT